MLSMTFDISEGLHKFGNLEENVEVNGTVSIVNNPSKKFT